MMAVNVLQKRWVVVKLKKNVKIQNGKNLAQQIMKVNNVYGIH